MTLHAIEPSIGEGADNRFLAIQTPTLQRDAAVAADDRPLSVREAAVFSWRQSTNRVSLGRAKADSPSPRDGPQHPVPQIGS